MKIVSRIAAFVLAAAAAAQAGFVPTGTMSVPRSFHTATLLLDGRVLIAGGYEEHFPWDARGSSRSELYDPSTDTFVPTGNMLVPRAAHLATVLPNGQVLITGGNVGAAAELYDPATGTFRATGSMHDAKYTMSATLLGNGKVLVGGRDRAELYDPATGTFQLAAPYPTRSWDYAEYWYSATLLADGRVLFVGDNPSMIYDPALDTFSFSIAPDMPDLLIYGLWEHSMTALADGKVLIAGGSNEDFGLVDFAELYDPASRGFAATSRLPGGRTAHAAVRLADGKVLIAGGTGEDCGPYVACQRTGLASALIYDPSAGSFRQTASMAAARSSLRATLLDDGRVLVTGGLSPVAELYYPSTAGSASVLVTEYRNVLLDDYFMTASEAERTTVESLRGAAAGWIRTGVVFGAANAPLEGWSPVCRFSGHNSHFHTVDPAECEAVKALPEWTHEGPAFYAVRVREGACPQGLRILWRAYNNGFPAREPRHRHSTDRGQLEGMEPSGWVVEGPAMCVE